MIQVKPVIAWYDFWVGFYYDREDTLYVMPIPCLGFKVYFPLRHKWFYRQVTNFWAMSFRGLAFRTLRKNWWIAGKLARNEVPTKKEIEEKFL